MRTMDAIVIRNVVKSFRKSTVRREYTTIKSELVRWVMGRKDRGEKTSIEALRGIDLVIPRGKTVGILGRNGSGKSTLLKLMTGIYAPTSGSIEINGRVSALLDLGAGFHPDFSGRENILINGIILGMSRAEVRERMDDIIAFSELGDFVDEPVRTYSSGMYMRLAFSVATHVDPDILIVDEILAVGDEHFGKKSLAKMMEFKRAGKTIVLVTHDMGTIERWCDTAAWLDAGRIRRVGTPEEVVQDYRRAVALAEEQSQVMVPAAIAADGGALPTLDSPKEEVSTATPVVKIAAVRLTGREGVEAQEVDTEEGLSFHVDFTALQPVEDVDFVVALRRVDGLLVYQTSTAAEALPLPQPLAKNGSLVLLIERVGLTAGDYTFDVSARSRSGEGYDVRRGVCPFTVRSAISDEGIARPVHRWRVESEGAARLELLPRWVGS
ncbi:ABC transporter ATP-binding protein [Stigmatella sp. ncwal1]|uniref:ABC transporter ATP-binding protein n=1 Tax=Stigmatella ashevillensis TaxID=2995309 RepID=A0ABT5DQ16_9BACT|nr:ABC transporter ATP-binding protein [Stigmatella ashevillena]MDC0715235.1 ABC transporter ATP-binding protein [Stigmatella ashevillena]